jgi:VanZ family protein
MLRQQQRVLVWGFWALALCVAVLSLMPTNYLPALAFSLWDKAQHALAFTALASLGLLAYPRQPWRVAIALLAFGGAIELAQAATGWRYGEWSDWLADTVGLAAGSALAAHPRRLAPCPPSPQRRHQRRADAPSPGTPPPVRLGWPLRHLAICCRSWGGLHRCLQSVMARSRAVFCVAFAANIPAIDCKKTPGGPFRSAAPSTCKGCAGHPLQVMPAPCATPCG